MKTTYKITNKNEQPLLSYKDIIDRPGFYKPVNLTDTIIVILDDLTALCLYDNRIEKIEKKLWVRDKFRKTPGTLHIEVTND